jgi:hypothetical protein
MCANKPFTKENLERCLKELAKEFRKKNGTKIPAEITIIGGASILLNYGFREMTYDIDAIIKSSSVMKEAINTVGDRLNLPTGWINTDFINTSSYTPKLIEFSKYYKTFSNILHIRTIASEYLVAMKLRAGRQYKNDFSDVIGILIEQDRLGDTLTFDRVKNAIIELYGSYDVIPETSRLFIESIFEKDDLKAFYEQCIKLEFENKDILIEFNDNYPEVLNENNISDILKIARERKKK